jgi:DNA gyrase subunit A
MNQEDNKPTADKSLTDRSIVQEVEQSYLDYAMSVIIARALPDARDGLKPVHRRVLYAMWNTGLKSSSRFRKSAAVVGEVLKCYHPHGDMAVYDTMVGMAQWFKINHTLVDGQGNFGSMDGDPPAAPRYTEARLTKIAEETLQDIEKETVDFIPNYDNTLTEPTVLPTRVPNLLLNGTVGIAVGMATNIPPHNLIELCEAITNLIDNPDLTVDELMEQIKGPDFPTGGTIHGIEGIKNAYATGKGKVIVRGDAEIIEEKRGHTIIISSIPFQVNKSDLISKIAALVKEKKIDGISDIRDESDRMESVRIVIELKSNAYPKKTLNKLYDLTTLQTAYHINILALVDRIQPRVLNLRSCLNEFIKHRKEVVRRRTEFDLARAKERAHILEGLKKALDHIDEIISLIKKSESRDDALGKLMSKYSFSEVQSNAILDMRLSALAALERKKIDDELREKLELIKDLESILQDEKKLSSIVKQELDEVKNKYGRPRRTKILKQEIGSFQVEDLIPNETVVVTLTEGNYIKRVGIDSYRKQGRGGKGVIGITPKEEDQVIQMEIANTHDTIYFFTDQGRVFSSKVFEIPPSSRQSRGHAIINQIQISPEEKVTTMLIISKEEKIQGKYFVMATQKGVIKRTAINAYKNIRKSGLIAIKLKGKDELRFVSISSGDDYIMLVTKDGKGILFTEKNVRAMGRSASGVIGIRLKTEDELISMRAFAQDPEKASRFELLTVLENGYGKRTQILKSFPIQKRSGYGVIASKSTAKTGKVVEAIITNDIDKDLIIASQNGQMIRIPMKSAKSLGRDTQGVRLMKLGKNDKIASVGEVASKKEKEEEKGQDTKDKDDKIKGNKPKMEIEINYYDKRK